MRKKGRMISTKIAFCVPNEGHCDFIYILPTWETETLKKLIITKTTQ